MNSALKLASSEQYEEAEKVFDDLIKQNPADGDLYYYYGRTIIKDYQADTFSNSMEEYANRAEVLFKEGISKAPGNALNQVGMGAVILLRSSDTTKAAPYFKQAETTIPVKLTKKNMTPKLATILVELGAAQLYGKVNNFNKAIAYLERAKTINPNDPNIYLTLGDVYIKMNDASKGLFNYNQALNKDPKSPLPKIKIGNIYMRVPNLNAARPYFEEAMAIDPTFSPVYRSLGELYTLAGRHDIAKENFSKYIELSGGNVPAKVRYANSLFRSKDYEGALGLIEEVLQVDNSRNYLNRLAAYACFEKKPQDLDKAKTYIESFFQNATEESIIPRDYAYYGRILFKIARNKDDSVMLEKSLEQFRKALSMDETDAALVSEMAVDYYYSQHYKEAVEMYELKAKLGKADKTDPMQIGKADYMIKDLDKADEVFSKIVAEDPSNIEALLYLARTYSLKEEGGERGLALPKFESLMQQIGSETEKYKNELSEAYTYMGSYYLQKRDYDVARQWYSKLLNLDPKNKGWQLRALSSDVIMYTNEKNYIQARSTWQKILEIDPNNQDAPGAIRDLTKVINAERNLR